MGGREKGVGGEVELEGGRWEVPLPLFKTSPPPSPTKHLGDYQGGGLQDKGVVLCIEKREICLRDMVVKSMKKKFIQMYSIHWYIHYFCC